MMNSKSSANSSTLMLKPKQPLISKINDKKTSESILLDSPSESTHRVTFDFIPKVKLIAFADETKSSSSSGPGLKRRFNFEVRDKTIILCKSMLQIAKKKAKKYSVIVPSSNSVVLKYKSKEDLETDLRSLGLKPKSYVENRLIINNLSFRESEESVSKFFSQFGPVEKVVLEKNAKGFCKGKATVTFSIEKNPIPDSKLYDLRLNGRLLRFERIKRPVVNTSRLFISHMNKNLKISDIRSALKERKHIPKSIKIDLQEGRNKGYGFIEFNSPQEAQAFIEDYENLESKIGDGSFVEFSQEKNLNNKHNKK